ncbi:hypothetical protein [Asticcacaulis sp. EMRT-3]|uniref:hypothetical protein n=1 Tax=Asticcacaulis sp. EMRT-3 TaxID=3040349 RepID=UPI0024AFE164|nr:hypothetical protein [Asticcacaulis sp. EMRT-3]MDI7775106.1 hypothetical protein [Asticcacaulis sp. EMRT-3]
MPPAEALMRDAPPEAPSAPHKTWLNDFIWRDGRIVIRKTGIEVRLNGPVLNEIFNWAIYLGLLNIMSFATRLNGRPRPRLWFAPDRPRAWYLLRGAAMWGGIDLATSAGNADACVYFDDSTIGGPQAFPAMTSLNATCTNISKSHVAQVFKDVFGYPLALDPLTAQGEIVEKPETNGVHGGRVITAPCAPRPGFVYQRLIDTRDDEGCCHDLRTPCAGGEAVLVWVKVKTPQGRFSIHNRRAYLADMAQTYTPKEQALIRQFTARMGLDWGGLDILRDRSDGRIYIVDVNKTDLGPLIALSWGDKIRSMNRLARALRRLVAR